MRSSHALLVLAYAVALTGCSNQPQAPRDRARESKDAASKTHGDDASQSAASGAPTITTEDDTDTTDPSSELTVQPGSLPTVMTTLPTVADSDAVAKAPDVASAAAEPTAEERAAFLQTLSGSWQAPCVGHNVTIITFAGNVYTHRIRQYLDETCVTTPTDDFIYTGSVVVERVSSLGADVWDVVLSLDTLKLRNTATTPVWQLATCRGLIPPGAEVDVTGIPCLGSTFTAQRYFNVLKAGADGRMTLGVGDATHGGRTAAERPVALGGPVFVKQ
jgi:hypothetical protein